ncbi:DivIVA domain-containing protein [Micromonospora sp. LOL_023]|uniref:DivIVA domain-containing protein n=1 Tax=Micromonospora sp. LOL_023 TaxID=3345418 RepID=UPI003A850A5F
MVDGSCDDCPGKASCNSADAGTFHIRDNVSLVVVLRIQRGQWPVVEVTADSDEAAGRVESWQVRAVRFTQRWRGLDPHEVYAYLREVADELDRLAGSAASERAEAERLREGLRQWRQRHVGCRFNDPPGVDADPGGANRVQGQRNRGQR